MASSNSKYDEDSREACNFGSSCYRKNKDHLDKFKHPIKETRSSSKTVYKGNLKQQQLNVFFKRNDQKASEVKKNDQEVTEVSKNEQTIEVKRKRQHSEEEEIEQPSCSSTAERATPESELVSQTAQKDTVSPDREDTKSETRSKSAEISKIECNKIIKQLFLVNMPDDFYDFWEFCKSLSPENPQDALDSIDLQLVGPFDVLMGLIDESLDQSKALRHWRYFYDPPEFQTVIRSIHANSFHIGYFRDEPDELPEFVASNFASKDAIITPIGDNLFGAVDWCLKESEKTATPFKKVKSSTFKTELLKWAKQKNYSLNSYTGKIRSRDRKVVARTFHNAGIVVPYDKKTELGYRPIAETSSNLTKLLKQIDSSKNDDERKIYFSKLFEIINWATIAMDESDYGTCLELGLDLFSFGSHLLHKTILQLLPPAYDLLNRQAFSIIIKAHLEDRKKGNALSALTR